ncbi:MAG TPA: cytochrome ubiquinol oxidase subunit I [Acidimicrobiales bacterium]|nr:cytochrome ubiquinol oxidase subunit I [Acidimicrobiales bacterium]
MTGLLAVAGGHDVVASRAQMASTLGFHIILACFGIAFPTVILVVHFIGLRRHDGAALLLARRWSKVLAVLVAVGAVSGTVLSFEMGLLWPGLFRVYGAAVGIPFAFEGIFFLLEAIFTAIYLYGWDRLSPWAHWWSGVPVAVSGLFGALCVVAANSWMNQPGGFVMSHGRVTAVHPLAVIFNAATTYEVPHMELAAYLVTAFGVAAPYAVGMVRHPDRRRSRYHRLGLLVPSVIAAICTPLQIFVGDTIARAIEHQQPVKFASMEYVVHTHRGVTEWIGGIYYHGHIYLGLNIPYFDSILVGFSPHTEVVGWDSVPRSQRPPLPSLIHNAFDLMVGIAFLMLALAAWLAVSWWRKRDFPVTRWFAGLTALGAPAAIVALECGWIVTEVGRQPWVVYKRMTVAQAATPVPDVPWTFGAIVALYIVLTITTLVVLALMARRWNRSTEVAEHDVPYGPGRAHGAASVRQ